MILLKLFYFYLKIFQPTIDFFNIATELNKLSKNVNNYIIYSHDFDFRGNRQPYEYSRNQKRGNKNYFPPLGWTGIGLNVTQFDDWKIKIGKINKEGEWCVVYHGTSLKKAKNIIIEGLKEGNRQAYQDFKDKEGNQIGTGVYFTPYIKIAELYSKPYYGINCVFMCRINPKKMKKTPKSGYYVVNAPKSDVIPYRLLIRRAMKITFDAKNTIQKNIKK